MQTTYLGADFGGQVRYSKFTLTLADLVALGAALTGNVALFTLPQGGVVLYAKAKSTVQGVITGGGTLTVSVGTAAAVTQFTAPTSDMVANAPSDTNYVEGPAACIGGGVHSAVGVVAHAITTTSNLSALTAAQVDVYVAYLNVTTPSA